MPVKLIPLLYLVLGMMSSSALAQTTEYNGLYVIIDKKNDCPNLKETFQNVKIKYCLSQKPIISAAEFISISEIKMDPLANTKSITLKLSQNGYNTWKGIIKNFPESKMALVVEGFVTGTFKNKGEIPASTIPISGPMDSQEIDWIYDHLKKQELGNKKE